MKRNHSLQTNAEKNAAALFLQDQINAASLLLQNKKKATALILKNQAIASKLLSLRKSNPNEVKKAAAILLKNEKKAAELIRSESVTAARSLSRRQAAAAAELLIQNQLVVENSHDAIIGVTLDGTITSWNRGAKIMFGYSSSDVIGKSSEILFPQETRDKALGLLDTIKNGEVIADHDISGLHRNGSKFDAAVSISPIITTGNKVVGVSIVERDITERKKAEHQVKELSQLRSKFIQIISHQLRTPLTVINWNVEELLKGRYGKMEENQHAFLQATHDASLEITHRINTLLNAMDIEENRVRYETGEVNMESVCTGSINEISGKCSLKNISCTYTPLVGGIPVMQLDGRKIRAVVMAFLENAVSYSKENGKIDVSLRLINDAVIFTVRDNGIGIPKTEQRYIFTRFFRASNASVMQQDGFGLNLFVAKHYIENHGGKIGFTSTEGKGSTFWFELPLKNESV